MWARAGGVLFHTLSHLCHFCMFVFEGKAQKICRYISTELSQSGVRFHTAKELGGLGNSASEQT